MHYYDIVMQFSDVLFSVLVVSVLIFFLYNVKNKYRKCEYFTFNIE